MQMADDVGAGCKHAGRRSSDWTQTGGRGIKGQYAHWITMAHPEDATIQRLGLKVPTEYAREQFSELIVTAQTDVQAGIVGVGRSAPTAQSVD